ncbi:MAG TPA: amidohydrolase family protein [Phycisphaerae bacterium]|jgi:predicted TIM-barrel fold metal-dependent hydrolase|nr:amidohydrolase family protein [Phycisphaerae bacterium]HOJ55692.1 amidohydrolase family protein [Phycisphaerae bacterium]HOL26674.1 amidohydrolase family protein [Phycisphaerae bacterium]HPP20577.1 amidohydrolase family protein [Phycisphaerae bacterium]HPU33996.1 amidohydrolase family protein [Phycisphaerae bacterium]
MRIDINACFGHWQYWDLPDRSADDLVALMDRHGIDQAAVLSLRGMILDWRKGNEETLFAAGRYPGRLVPFATISPFLGGSGGELERALDAGFRGVRLYPSFHSYRLDAEFVDEICGVAGQRDVPVMIPTRPMMNWRFAAIPIDTIGAVIDRHPNTMFILSGPNYLIESQAVVRILKRCPNAQYEISCLQGFNAVAKMAGEVGCERLLFGTGAVLNYPACNVAKLDHAELTDAQRAAIASENAASLLGLEG